MSALRERSRGSQLALAPGRTCWDGERSPLERSRSLDGGRLTLEQRLERVWEGLSVVGVCDCPVCGGRMESHPGSGCCTACGTTIS